MRTVVAKGSHHYYAELKPPELLQTFGEQLAGQTAATGSQRATDRDLSLPRRRSREQQVRDVDAGDEQHEGDRHRQNLESRPHGFDQLLASASAQHVDPEGCDEKR